MKSKFYRDTDPLTEWCSDKELSTRAKNCLGLGYRDVEFLKTIGDLGDMIRRKDLHKLKGCGSMVEDEILLAFRNTDVVSSSIDISFFSAESYWA